MDKLELAYLQRTRGIYFPRDVRYYLPKGMAMDAAQPQLITVGNSGIPAFLTTYMDPEVIRVLVTPNKAADIFGEAKKGDFTTNVAEFPLAEVTGEVSSYGDYNENGVAGYNVNFENRQSYRFQVITQWGDLELETLSLAKIDAASEKNRAAAVTLDKYMNNVYFFGVQGLMNYGLLNDPSLAPAIAPGPKAANANLPGPWTTNGGVTATPNEIFTDIQTLFLQVVNQSGGTIDRETPMTLALSPASDGAITATNIYKVNVPDLLKKNFPNLRIVSAQQYLNATTGNLMQLIATTVEGQQTGYCAFAEKMRAHRIVPSTSAFLQKKSAMGWGAIVRQPFAIATMVGI